jgi:Domain of unknown function (DUF4124)
MLRAWINGLLSLIVVSIVATSAAAAGIQEWRTPDGRLFFGDRPPPGSASIGTIEGTVPQIAVRDIDTTAEKPRSDEYTWRDGVGCQDLTFTDVNEGRFDGINRRIVQGSIKHNGRHLVRDVKVCGNGTCDLLRGGNQIDRGESEAFHLDIQSGDPISLRIECSVREPA